MLNLYQISLDLQKESSALPIASKKLVKAFYHKLESPDHELEEILASWKTEFRFIYGDIANNISSNKKVKPTELAEIYGLDTNNFTDEKVTLLFLAIQTYFSLLVRLITYKLISSIKRHDSQSDHLYDFITMITNGTYFRAYGIDNYCYEDWYCWFEQSWDTQLEEAVGQLVVALDDYDTIPHISDFIALHNNDYIKQIYETIIPKQLRHALGEYYTPDWMALHTIQSIAPADTIAHTRFLDPTCGSGTFLFKTLQLIRRDVHDIQAITQRVVGYDINPLAVLTSKTNYIISNIDIIHQQTSVHLPVYQFDVINAPTVENDHLIIDLNHGETYKLPLHLITSDNYKHFIMEVRRQLTQGTQQCLFEVDTYEQNPAYVLYSQLNAYSQFVGHIILNTIVNRIQGYLEAPVDIIIGNPPWVNWEYLPLEYRTKSQYLWKEYGIFSATGRDLSFSKEDISVLLTYVVIDKYLKQNGYLAFVIRQAIFKSAQNGVGFRKFKVKEDGYPIKALKVDDLSHIKAFENATNSTAIMYFQKNHLTEYPVCYNVWKKNPNLKRASFGSYAELEDIQDQIIIYSMVAMPAIKEDPTSLWITADATALDAVQGVLGSNDYRARTGIFTGGANAVYWMNVHSQTSSSAVMISNITERAKRKVQSVTQEIEPTLIYPLVQGSDVQKWQVNTKAYILCPHTHETKMQPIDKKVMEEKYPLTFEYLLSFKQELDERKGFAGWEKEIQKENFHAILRVGEYTFSKYKVAWRYIASEFITAVITQHSDPFLGNKMLIPNEKVMYVSTDDENEAYYLCGILSSDPIAFTVKSYMNPTSISAHVLEKLQIATFDPTDEKHLQIAALCQAGHATENTTQRIEILEQINGVVAQIYHITPEQMSVIKNLLSL
ncbi:MAG: N-6 DNA methylase [Cellulosilyticaceae bacterium]